MKIATQHPLSHLHASAASAAVRRKEQAGTGERQRQVDAHFQGSAQYWKDLYQQDGVFEVIHQQRRDLVLAFVEKLALPPHSPVLEIGCGAGATTVPLARRGCHVRAVDTVDEMLRLTLQAASQAGVSDRVLASREDAHRLSFNDESFALVIAMGVTPYLHTLDQALREMRRVLRPGGHLIINADNRWRLNYALDPLRFPALAGVRSRLRSLMERAGLLKVVSSPRPQRYSRNQFDTHLAAAGLRKVEWRTLGFGPFSFLNCNLFSDSRGVALHHKLQTLADRGLPVLRSTGAQYIVLATKPGLA